MPDGDALTRLGSLLRDEAAPQSRLIYEPEFKQPFKPRRRAPISLQTATTMLAPAPPLKRMPLMPGITAIKAAPWLQTLCSSDSVPAKAPSHPVAQTFTQGSAHLQRHKSSRRQAVVLDRVSRWRIWTAVVAGHAAAFIALAAIHVSVGGSQQRMAPEIG